MDDLQPVLPVICRLACENPVFIGYSHRHSDFDGYSQDSGEPF
jgi:hypothetical protein